MLQHKLITKIILLVLTYFLLTACSSAKINLADGVGQGSFKTLAVLPVEYPAEIQREKIDLLRDSLEVELKNSGFVVLADRLVRKICSVPACPERSILASRYFVDGFVTLQIRSVSRANFLAGYVNNVSGTLIVSDQNSKDLVSIKQNEAERGGLVFNSGQIIQGIISQAENTEVASFNRISLKFIQSLVEKLPKPKSLEVNTDAVAVNISNVNIKQLQPQVFEVCADTTTNSLVSLIVNKKRSNLREVSPSRYCGVFLLDKSVENGSILKVEAKSPFGNSVRTEINTEQAINVCNLEGSVFLKNQDGKTALELNCTEVSKNYPVIGSCNGEIKRCPDHKFIVFRAPSPAGPYERIGEFQSTSWRDKRASTKNGTADYRLVSVNRSGTWSLPVSVRPAS